MSLVLVGPHLQVPFPMFFRYLLYLYFHGLVGLRGEIFRQETSGEARFPGVVRGSTRIVRYVICEANGTLREVDGNAVRVRGRVPMFDKWVVVLFRPLFSKQEWNGETTGAGRRPGIVRAVQDRMVIGVRVLEIMIEGGGHRAAPKRGGSVNVGPGAVELLWCGVLSVQRN